MSKKRLVLHVRLRCGSLSITTPASLPVNEYDVRSVLHGQVSLETVNQIYVFHEAMNGCKNKRLALEMKILPFNLVRLRNCLVYYRSFQVSMSAHS